MHTALAVNVTPIIFTILTPLDKGNLLESNLKRVRGVIAPFIFAANKALTKLGFSENSNVNWRLSNLVYCY